MKIKLLKILEFKVNKQKNKLVITDYNNKMMRLKMGHLKNDNNADIILTL